MSNLERFERLAGRARERIAPGVNVADRVMRTIASGAVIRQKARFWPIALVLSAAAAAALLFALQSIAVFDEPFVEFLSSLTEVQL